MTTVGLTGGLASGKSFVGEALRELGCQVVEADALGHETLAPGGLACDAVIAEFGPGILDAEGRISRPKLGAIVFDSPAALQRLNAIVHPAVHELSRRRFEEIRSRDPDAIVVYVAAILVETGGYREFDKLIVTSCARERQIERAMKRPGATMADTLARLDRQLPVQKKREVADYVIDTDGTKEETLRQSKMVFEDLRRLAS